MKIQQTKIGQFFITLPRKVMEAIGWNKGDTIVLRINDDLSLTLKKDHKT